MLSRQELKLIELFRRDVLASFSILQLMRRTKSRSYSAVFKAAGSLIKGGVLISEIRGHSRICRMNLGSQLAVKHLALLDYAEAAARKVPNIDEISKAVPTPYHTLLVAGSHAAGKPRKGSDIDVVVIVDDCTDVKKALSLIKTRTALLVPEVHPFVFRKTDFLGMLLAPEENYGKEVFRKRLVFYGGEAYYGIIREAVAHGFNS